MPPTAYIHHVETWCNKYSARKGRLTQNTGILILVEQCTDFDPVRHVTTTELCIKVNS